MTEPTDEVLDLRRQAEQLAGQQLRNHALPPPEQLPELVHELQVHQIELEMQNEALRQSQAELEVSRNRYTDLYDFAPVGYLTLDEQGGIREINLTACGMLNRQRQRLLGHPLVGFVDQSGKNRFCEYLQQCRGAADDAVLTTDTLLRRGHVGDVHVRLHTTPSRHASTDQREYRVIVVDRNEVQESSNRLQLALQSGRMGLWDWDLQTNQMIWDHRQFELLGLPVQSSPVNAGIFFQVVHAEDLPALRRAIDNAMESGSGFYHEFRVILADGRVRWLCGIGRVSRHGDGQPVRMTGVHFDITERKQTEAELRSLNETLEQRVAERTLALGMLRDIAEMANRAQDIQQALEHCLRRVCEHNGWWFGHAYLATADDPRVLLPADVWYAPDTARFSAFRELTLQTPLRPGEGLVGAVFASGRPMWSTDIGAELHARRLGRAEEWGIAAAVAFPIPLGDRVTGVLEFFSGKSEVPDEGVLASMASVGIQLGRVIERSVLQYRLLTLAEDEYRRIGQELHDDVGQELTGLVLKNEALLELLGDRPGPEPELTRNLLVSLGRTREKIRALSRGLVPTELEFPALESALEELAQQTSEMTAIS